MLCFVIISLHVCIVCIWRCEQARFCVEFGYSVYIDFHSFIHILYIYILVTKDSSTLQSLLAESSTTALNLSEMITTTPVVDTCVDNLGQGLTCQQLPSICSDPYAQVVCRRSCKLCGEYVATLKAVLASSVVV